MQAKTELLGPILTAHLFPELEARLLDLLRSLSHDDWEKQTLAPKWKVKDVAAHLLDTQLRKLSICRDGYVPEKPNLNADDGLVDFINRLNAGGVGIYRRLSSSVLIELMAMVSRQSIDYHSSLDPMADAIFPVTWAGESTSLNWFDTARELTERWHHQEQIRLAVNKPGIMIRELYFPVLDTFMRALPFSYRKVSASDGALAQFNVTGDCGANWFLYREAGSWELVTAPVGEKISETTIPQEIAWRIFTKGIDRESARSKVATSGDPAVALHILNTIAIVG